MNLKFNFLIIIIIFATSCDTTKVRSYESCYTKKNGSATIYKFIRQEGHLVVVQDLNAEVEVKLWNDDLVEIPCKKPE